jgi:dTDP-4-dehydrorhamnose 3,5-epimerase
MFEIRETRIAGCVELRSTIHQDERGRFVKTVHADWFARHGLSADFREQYYSESRRDVVRGLHFQAPPHHHAKLVYCAHGAILDAVVDLRVGSPTFRGHAVVRLDAQTGNMLYVPPGLAHGFLTVSGSALVVYNVTSVHAPAHDLGILWSSAGIAWPVTSPIVSARDAAFPPLAEFASPFTFEATMGDSV